MNNFIKLLQLRMIQKIQKREKYIYICVNLSFRKYREK